MKKQAKQKQEQKKLKAEARKTEMRRLAAEKRAKNPILRAMSFMWQD